MNNDIKISESEAKSPICPYCEQEIREIGIRRIESRLGVRFLYFCCRCRKTLGISHRKGFWMG